MRYKLNEWATMSTVYNNMLTVKYMLFPTIEMHNPQKYVVMGKT